MKQSFAVEIKSVKEAQKLKQFIKYIPARNQLKIPGIITLLEQNGQLIVHGTHEIEEKSFLAAAGYEIISADCSGLDPYKNGHHVIPFKQINTTARKKEEDI